MPSVRSGQALVNLFVSLAMCFAVSIFAFYVYVSYLPGGNVGHVMDTLSFTALTIPYAITIGASAVLINGIPWARDWQWRWILPSLVDSIAGTCWALLAAFLLWPLLRTIDLVHIPVTWFWMLGAWLSLLTSAVVLFPTKGKLRASYHISGKVKVITVFLSLALVGALWVYIPIYLAHSAFAESEYFLLPIGYEGPVLIIYDQENGLPALYQGRVRIYQVAADGVLRTQFSQSRLAVNRSFWYVGQQGALLALPKVLRPDCADYLPDDPVAVCSTYTQSGPAMPAHDGFIIGRFKDRDTNLRRFEEVFQASLVSGNP